MSLKELSNSPYTKIKYRNYFIQRNCIFLTNFLHIKDSMLEGEVGRNDFDR